MVVSELFKLLQKANPHQFTDDMLLMWLKEAEKDIDEYLRHNYKEADEYEEAYAEFDFDTLGLNDSLLIDEPHIYIEWLSHKIDFANGEYERANNHAAMYNAFLTGWKERFFRGHTKEVKHAPNYIRGLV